MDSLDHYLFYSESAILSDNMESYLIVNQPAILKQLGFGYDHCVASFLGPTKRSTCMECSRNSLRSDVKTKYDQKWCPALKNWRWMVFHRVWYTTLNVLIRLFGFKNRNWSYLLLNDLKSMAIETLNRKGLKNWIYVYPWQTHTYLRLLLDL